MFPITEYNPLQLCPICLRSLHEVGIPITDWLTLVVITYDDCCCCWLSVTFGYSKTSDKNDSWCWTLASNWTILDSRRSRISFWNVWFQLMSLLYVEKNEWGRARLTFSWSWISSWATLASSWTFLASTLSLNWFWYKNELLNWNKSHEKQAIKFLRNFPLTVSIVALTKVQCQWNLRTKRILNNRGQCGWIRRMSNEPFVQQRCSSLSQVKLPYEFLFYNWFVATRFLPYRVVRIIQHF